MNRKKILAVVLLSATTALAGCAYDDYGYGGVNVGYGYPGYYDAWGPYDYAPFGWYDGYYYPGTGYWTYNREGRRFRWSDRQREYWEHRRDRSEWHGPKEQPWQPSMRDDHQWRGQQWRGRDWRGQQWQGRGSSPAQVNPPQSQQTAPTMQPRGDSRGNWGARRERRGD